MDTRTVLVVTGMDTTADAVIGELNRRAVPVTRFNLSDFPAEISFAAQRDTGWFTGHLRTPSRLVDLGGVRALYYRRPDPPEFPHLPGCDAGFAEEQARFGFSGVLQALPGCLYVNHPRCDATAEWKPAQLQVAARLGFSVPPTLITNSPEEAIRFAKEHDPVVYKSLSWVPYEVDGLPHAPWVREVDPAELDETVAGTAHMFQARVDKTADVRVTVVGERVFCAKITSPLTDWRERYDLIAGYAVIDPPPQLPGMLRAYLDQFGLVYGCFDFGLDRDGTWWWYECNPAGEWGWLQSETDLSIVEAFADVLERGLR